MSLPRELDDDEENYAFSDFSFESEDLEDIHRRREVRKLLEDRLEFNRLRKEIDELDGDFDWDDIDD